MTLITSKPNDSDAIVDDKGVSTFEYNSYNEEVESAINSYVPISNVTNAAPTVTNDSSEGYGYFSEWIDTTGPTIYKCKDPSLGAANWQII